jgi:hypothetical protein
MLTKAHMLVAAFIFPVALMFLVTGSLYTWGFKGSYESESTVIDLQAPLTGDLEQAVNLVQDELASRGIERPSGSPGIKRGGTSFKLEWTGAGRDVVLEPTADPGTARLTIKDTTWYRHLVQLHKAKGGQPFKFYAAILAASLFISLLSGFIMAWQVPRYRRLVIGFAIAGVAMFFAMLGAS